MKPSLQKENCDNDAIQGAQVLHCWGLTRRIVPGRLRCLIAAGMCWQGKQAWLSSAGGDTVWCKQHYITYDPPGVRRYTAQHCLTGCKRLYGFIWGLKIQTTWFSFVFFILITSLNILWDTECETCRDGGKKLGDIQALKWKCSHL